MTFHLFIVALAGAGAAVIAMVSYSTLCTSIISRIANTFWLLLSISYLVSILSLNAITIYTLMLERYTQETVSSLVCYCFEVYSVVIIKYYFVGIAILRFT